MNYEEYKRTRKAEAEWRANAKYVSIPDLMPSVEERVTQGFLCLILIHTGLLVGVVTYKLHQAGLL